MIRIIPAEMRKARPEHQLSALREKANSGYRDFGGLKDKNQANLGSGPIDLLESAVAA